MQAKGCITLLFFLCIHSLLSAQVATVEQLDKAQLNWQNLDLEKDGIAGTGVNRVYQELIAGKESKKTIVVAVIDGGVDIFHEDLQGRIWINEDETPGNQIDDDNNGYIDDVHGWNFIGNAAGENVLYENMEYTRLVRGGDGPLYAEAKKLFDEELASRQQEKANLQKFEETYRKALQIIQSNTGIQVKNLRDAESIPASDKQQVQAAREFLLSRFRNGFTEEILQNLKKQNEEYLTKLLNPGFDARTLIGDDTKNLDDSRYGNPDVKGPRANHGTSVAGIIAAIRDNGKGIDGIATNVRIMCLRSTPFGDERDKDVALAIKYAVDNGAHIINMSFGKPLSPDKKWVDQMVRYAEEKGVLIVHGAGNEATNIDVKPRYPSNVYDDGKTATNWINVGASDKTNDEKVTASFSNFGKQNVHLFAPGMKIISTDSSNTYSMNSGTSLSAPVVSGVAALLLSYYPDLTPQQLIALLQGTARVVEQKVLEPASGGADRKKVRFTTLAQSGLLNAYEAFKKAGSQ